MIRRIPAIAAIHVLTLFLTSQGYGAPTTESASAEMLAALDSASAAPFKVMIVNRKFNFVLIDQGLQSGLKLGDRLKIFKQGQEKATVQIDKLYNRFSIATFIETDPKLPVVEGDEVRKV